MPFKLSSECSFALELPLNISSRLLLCPGSKHLFSSVSLWVSDRHSVACAARHGLMLSVAGDSLESEVSVLEGLTQLSILWQQIETKCNCHCIRGSFSDTATPAWLCTHYVYGICKVHCYHSCPKAG